MRLYWINVGPKFNAWCPYMKTRGHRYTQGKGHILIETEIGVMQL